MFSLSRREFLKGSALLAAAAAGGSFSTEQAEADPPVQANPNPGAGGAAGRLNVAVIGVRGRGMDHINGFLNRALNCRITHICDVDTAVVGPPVRRIERVQ